MHRSEGLKPSHLPFFGKPELRWKPDQLETLHFHCAVGPAAHVASPGLCLQDVQGRGELSPGSSGPQGAGPAMGM